MDADQPGRDSLDDFASPKSISAAFERIRDFVLPTPLVRLRWLDAPGRRVWAKLECNHRSGSFKARGAFAALTRFERGTEIITASAGNHGLAIAQAAERLGLHATVHVPFGASEAKVRRIASTGADIVVCGQDLAESIRFARASALQRAAPFISPFDHADVVAGQGTIVTELAAERPQGFDHLVIPFGGGGLFVGIANAAAELWPHTQLHAVVPAVFRREQVPGGFSNQLLKPSFPSIADGLGVQHEAGSSLAALIDRHVDKVSQATEQEISAAMLALLYQESLLVEGAGAIALTPLLRTKSDRAMEGDVLAIVSGGNVSVGQLARVITDDFPAEFDRTRLGLANRPLVGEVGRSCVPDSPSRPGLRIANGDDRSELGEAEALDTAADSWRRHLKELTKRTAVVRAKLQHFVLFVKSEKLDCDKTAIGAVETELDLCDQVIDGALAELEHGLDLSRRYRIALQHYALASRALQWCSQSSDHVREVMFFDPSDVQSAAVNYDRYGSTELRRAEEDILAQLGYEATRPTLLLTSSGQAAFSTVEGFLIRKGMRRAPVIVTSPYIYFEAMEQLAALKSIRVDAASSWRIEAMVAAVERTDASALFVDPVANNSSMDVVDLRELACELAKRDWSDRYLVIDGTLLSGGVDPFQLFAFPNAPQVLLYESLSKYGQLGLDLQMAGAIVAPTILDAELRRIRRNLGSTMYAAQANLLPRCSRGDFLLRMRRLTGNAERLTSTLRLQQLPGSGIRICYPEDWRSLGWLHGGGLVSITFADPGFNNHGFLEAVIEVILGRCRLEGLSITKGVSFGFNVTRISAAASMAGTTDPFLRISVGDEPAEEFDLLAQAIAAGLSDAVCRVTSWWSETARQPPDSGPSVPPARRQPVFETSRTDSPGPEPS